MCGIYKITNLVNQKSYIGQSTNIRVRFNKHRTAPFNPKNKAYDYPLSRAIRKYGVENFSFEIIEICNRSELNEKEIAYIAYYDTYYNGYNQDKGGDAATHYTKLSDELVLKIIDTLKTSKESSDSLGKKFGVSGSMIRRINNGKACRRDDVTYPIRNAVSTHPHYDPHAKAKGRDHVLDDGGNILYHCEKCGAPIVTQKAKLCVRCAHDAQRRTERPDPLELASMIKESNFTAVGELFGVNANSIINWCKQYEIPHKLNDLINWYNEHVGIDERVEPSKNRLSKTPVGQIDPQTGKVIATFESATAAAQSFGRKKGSKISDVCNGRAQSAYGYLWRFASPPTQNTTSKP